MVKTNIFKSRNIIPRHVQTYRIRTSSINIDFNELERYVFNNGWYCFRQNDQSTWGTKILNQIKAKTGVVIPISKLGGLAKFLGINLDRWL